MGIVYEGEQQTPKRSVAVKVVRGGQYIDDYQVKLFEREVQTLARLKHPAIAAIYDAGHTDDGQHFFAMELAQGVQLTEYVRAKGIPRRQRLELFCKICEAINYAHQRGVIHRDLKPTNILVDSEGQLKVLDFGLARITDPEDALTTGGSEVGQIRGTLPYMSPEEARGDADEIDVRSDVYSLGVILYELLTGELPHRVSRAALHEAVKTICEEPPRRPSTIDRTIRGDLETITLKALEKERGRRYQSAAALAEDVERFLSDQPILARRASVLYRFRKLVVRHKIAFALAISFTTAIFLVYGTALSWINQATRAMQEGAVRLDNLNDQRFAVVELKFARYLHAQGRLREAEPYYRRAVETFRRIEKEDPRYLGRQDPDNLGVSMLELSTLLLAQEQSLERLQTAETLLQEAVRIFEASGAEWEDQSREASIALGEALLGQALVLLEQDEETAPSLERLQRAEALVEEAFDVFEASGADWEEQAGRAHLALGEAADALVGHALASLEPGEAYWKEDWDDILGDSEDILRQAGSICRTCGSPCREFHIQALQALRDLYGPDVWDVPEKAADYDAEIDALKRTIPETARESPATSGSSTPERNFPPN